MSKKCEHRAQRQKRERRMQRLFEEDEGGGATERVSVGLWRASSSAQRLRETLEWLFKHRRRATSSWGARQVAEEACLQLQKKGFSGVKLEPFVAMGAWGSPTWVWGLGAFLPLACLLVSPPLAVACSWLWSGLALAEWAGWVCVSKLLWPGSQAYYVEASVSKAQAARHARTKNTSSQADHVEASVSKASSSESHPCAELVLWAALDLPPADLIYHPRRFAHWLRPLYRWGLLPGGLLALLVVGMPLWLSWWWVAPSPEAANLWVLWSVGLILAVGLLGGWVQPQYETGEEAAAVACAIETAERLRQLSLPFDVRLLLVAGSRFGAGMEAWQQRQERAAPPIAFCVTPLGARGTSLMYATHQGLLVPVRFSQETVQTLDWASARLSVFSSSLWQGQPFYGSNPNAFARLREQIIVGGVPLTATAEECEGDEHRLSDEALLARLDLELLDICAGFLVVLAQALTFEFEGGATSSVSLSSRRASRQLDR